MLCGSLDGRGVWREWIHAYVWLSAFALHLKLLQHCFFFFPFQTTTMAVFGEGWAWILLHSFFEFYLYLLLNTKNILYRGIAD